MITIPKFNMNIMYITLTILLVMLVISQVQPRDNKTKLGKAADDISDGIHNASSEFKD